MGRSGSWVVVRLWRKAPHLPTEGRYGPRDMRATSPRLALMVVARSPTSANRRQIWASGYAGHQRKVVRWDESPRLKRPEPGRLNRAPVLRILWIRKVT